MTENEKAAPYEPTAIGSEQSPNSQFYYSRSGRKSQVVKRRKENK